MSRKVDEWVGKTDDTPIPPRVKLRIFHRCEGKCHRCRRKIPVGDAYIFEHLIAVVNDGPNAENNIVLTCSWCKPLKDAEDVAIKSKTAAVQKKHLGIAKPKGRPMPGTKASGLRKRMDGTVERR